MSAADDMLSERLLKAVEIAEEIVDEELRNCEDPSDEDLKLIRRKRCMELKEKQRQKQEWLNNGHGTYSELPDERSFFEATKKSTKVICLFHVPTIENCRVFDKHLQKIAEKHVETRFVKANAERFPFVTSRLNIRVFPTLALIVDSKTVDYIRGFSDFGNSSDFKTDVLEKRLARAGVINFEQQMCAIGSESIPHRSFTKVSKKTVRCKNEDSCSDDDW